MALKILKDALAGNSLNVADRLVCMMAAENYGSVLRLIEAGEERERELAKGASDPSMFGGDVAESEFIRKDERGSEEHWVKFKDGQEAIAFRSPPITLSDSKPPETPPKRPRGRPRKVVV